MDQNSITLGPIIGTVTQDSARILVEFQISGQVTLQLRGDQNLEQTEVVEAQLPKLFIFKGLQAGKSYQVWFSEQQVGSFKTFGQVNAADLKFAIISCNAIEIVQKTDKNKQLWYDVEKKVKNNSVDYLFHLGDQIYTDFQRWEGKDCLFTDVESMVKDVAIQDLEQYTEKARNLVREQYRKTWSFEPTRQALANCPNRMSLDDHEIVDDAGKDPQIKDPNNWRYWFSNKVARFVYYEYQVQLEQDVDFNNLDSVSQEFKNFILQQNAFFWMDQRAHFMWYGDEWVKEQSYLGEKQRQALLRDLGDEGQFKDCKNLFIISALPMIFLTEHMTNIGEIGLDDFREQWIFSHQKELVEYLDLFRNWQQKKQGRSVTLIGGDVHMGGYHDIYYKGKPCFKQITSSAINSQIANKWQRIVTQLALEIHEDLPGGYTFETHEFVFDANYAVFNAQEDEKGSLVQYSIINNTKGIKEGKTWSNRNFILDEKSSSCNCSIF